MNVDTVAATQQQTASSVSKGKLDEDFTRFMTLLITQLQNQDPLDPMDANEFTSQLVQFANVEQQIEQNANLEKLLDLQQTSQVASMVNYLGNTIEAKSQKINLEEGGLAEFTYTLDGNAKTVSVFIRNADGVTVSTIDGNTEIGQHVFTWDGNDSSGNLQSAGVYTIVVNALDTEDALMKVDQTVFGKVTGAGAENGVVYLNMGEVSVTMDNVLSVRETVNHET